MGNLYLPVFCSEHNKRDESTQTLNLTKAFACGSVPVVMVLRLVALWAAGAPLITFNFSISQVVILLRLTLGDQ